MGETEERNTKHPVLNFVDDVLESVAEVIILEAIAEVLVASISVAGEVAVAMIDGISSSIDS